MRLRPGVNKLIQPLHQTLPSSTGGVDSGSSGRDGGFVDAYLRRIGFSGRAEANLNTLAGLTEKHIAAIPFEALDVFVGNGVDIGPAAVEEKLIRRGRGGYCFEQNSLFLRALMAIGFDVEALIGRVLWRLPPGSPLPGWTHLALRVTIEDTRYLVDVGFGDNVPTVPLLFDAAGPQETAHGAFRLVPLAEGRLLEARVGNAWLPAYLLSGENPVQADLDIGNWYTATHPKSEFRTDLIAARTSAEARYTLLNGKLSIRRNNGRRESRILDADGIERALAETFLLPLEKNWRPHIERAAQSEPEQGD